MNTRRNNIDRPQPGHAMAPRASASLSAIAPAMLAATIAATIAAGFVGGTAAAQCQPDPMPTGPSVSPADNFSVAEYAFVHSSTNLQGRPALRKTAAGLFWNPAGSFGTGIARAFGGFSSAVVVNNPSPQGAAIVRIEYHDPAGNLLGTSGPITIAPDGTHIEDASMIGLSPTGIGSATIIVENPNESIGIVGSTLHYFDSIGVPGWGIVTDPDSLVLPSGAPVIAPGEGSYQQLQETPLQLTGPDGTDWRGWHVAGPFRFTNTSVNDFDNGSAPVLMVANPNEHQVDVAFVMLAVGPSGPIANLGTTIHSLAPQGMVMETSLWTGLNQLSSNFFGLYDFDIMVVVIALDGSPLVGDSLVIDAFGDNEGAAQNRNLNLGRRMRMVSSSIAGAPGFTYGGALYASDVSTFTPTGGTSPMIRTGIKVANAGFSVIGPVTVEYFDHLGTRVATDTVPMLPPAATLHIGLGEAQTPNFPANMWNGSVRVQASCASDRLIGWTAREIGKAPASWPANYQYRKAFGEEMTGANGLEPGLVGTDYILSDNTVTSRRVASLVRTTSSTGLGYWPGYTTFTNGFAFDNTGAYVYRFMSPAGIDVTNYGPQPFAGLRFGATSFTYEDSDLLPIGPLGLQQGNGSARVDLPAGSNFVHGINVLGDPFEEYLIGSFARRNLGPYSKPGSGQVGGGAASDDTGPGPGVPTGKH